jgi:hypothetical protein
VRERSKELLETAGLKGKRPLSSPLIISRRQMLSLIGSPLLTKGRSSPWERLKN